MSLNEIRPSTIPLHPYGVFLLAFMAALVVYAGSFINPAIGTLVAFICIWSLLEKERKRVMEGES